MRVEGVLLNYCVVNLVVMDDYIERRIREAEKSDTALTNDVYFTSEGTVVKIYPKYPLSSFYTSFANLLGLRFQYVSRETRMSNEVEVKERIKETGLSAPEVVYRGEEAIEFEKVPGVSGYDYLETCSEREARELGRKVGEFLPELHSKDVALRDFRVSNMHVDEDLELYLIDHEYSVLGSGKVFKWVDELTLFSSVRQTQRYRDFVEGYTEVKNASRTALLFSVFTSLGHAILLERSWGRMKKIFSSIKTDITG